MCKDRRAGEYVPNEIFVAIIQRLLPRIPSLVENQVVVFPAPSVIDSAF